jgi:DNA-binding response OmpR family regulator
MRILLIEDRENLAKAVKTGLEKEGYAADYVLDGEAGQRRLELSHKEYDAAIVDLMLPKKGGAEVTHDIREKKITTPILILTGEKDLQTKVKVLNSGADDYLTKPFSFDELIARVKALMRRPVQSLPIELKIQDITMDTATRKVFRGDHELVLTLKEFSLLEYLMRNPNRVLKREEIFDHTWDFAANFFSNVVDVHIKNLRKKIDFGRSEKMVETIRGVGYRMKV